MVGKTITLNKTLTFAKQNRRKITEEITNEKTNEKTKNEIITY